MQGFLTYFKDLTIDVVIPGGQLFGRFPLPAVVV